MSSNHKPKLSAGIFAERFRMAKKWEEEASDFACPLDWLGDAKQHPEGSERRELPLVRDQVDWELNDCCRHFAAFRRGWVETTRCLDLLIEDAPPFGDVPISSLAQHLATIDAN
jgi:hypothetical protein